MAVIVGVNATHNGKEVVNEIVYRQTKVQGGVLKESNTSVSDSERENWVKLNTPVALISCVNGENGSIRVGQIVHAIEVRLKHDEVRIQERAGVSGLSFNFDLASDPEAIGRRLGLACGTKIETHRSHSLDNEWSEDVRATRRWGINGKITGCHNSASTNALYYSVLHDDGTSSCYFPTEVV